MSVSLPWSGRADHRCFGCAPGNPRGLGLRFDDHGDSLSAEFTLGADYQSYPGVVHGGIVAVVCDETMGNLVVLRLGVLALTTSMRMRYVGVVRTGVRHRCVASATFGDDLVRATAEIFDSHDVVVGTATATYQLQRSAV